jgi:hypothetical protein
VSYELHLLQLARQGYPEEKIPMKKVSSRHRLIVFVPFLIIY